MEITIQNINDFFTQSTKELHKIISDQKFLQTVTNELKIAGIDLLKKTITLSINNSFISKQFSQSYLKSFNNLFNEICGENFILSFIENDKQNHNISSFDLCDNIKFDSLVSGKFNEEAIHCGKLMVDKKWPVLLIFGDAGTGKTTLLNAIATEYLEKWNTNKAILIDAGELGQKIFNASHSGTSVQKIKNKLLENDLILIDGIEYFCKKPILINIVDEIIRVSKSNKKNIVFSSKTPLNEIKKKDRTLYSLINGEMNCIISLTHLNDKKRFIVNVIKQQNFDIQLTDDALQYLANQNFDGNLNSLNILIQRVGVFPKQNNNTLLGKQDVENLTEVVKNDKYSCTATIETICKYYDMQYHDVTSKSRIKDIVFVRSICMYILYEKFNLSLKKIGNFFNNRSHSTIKHSISKVKTLKKKDNKVSLKLKELENLF